MSLRRLRAGRPPGARRQGGATLIILLTAVVLVAAATLLDRLQGSAALRVRSEADTSRALAQAKAALLGWAVSHPVTPGTLPFPDRGSDAAGYDGDADCVTNGLEANWPGFLIGRLPARGETSGGCTTWRLDVDFRDGAGEPLWYAVSRNLVNNRGTGGTPSVPDPAIGPELLDTPLPDYAWLTVRNRDGSVLSSEVAAVIIAPGPALEGQSRLGVTPTIENFLDSVTIGGVDRDNSDADFDYVIYPDSSLTEDADDRFNDRLVYITADELLQAVERRALAEVSGAMAAYRAAHGGYPWLATFVDPGASNFQGDVGTRIGHLPVHTAGTAFESGYGYGWNIDPGTATITETYGGDNFAGVFWAALLGLLPVVNDSDVEIGQATVAAPGIDNCRWSSAAAVDCDTADTPADDAPPDTAASQYTKAVEYDPPSFGTSWNVVGALSGVSDPDAATARERAASYTGAIEPGMTVTFRHTSSTMCVIIPFLGVNICPFTAWREKTLTTNAGTQGTIAFTDVHYDLDVANDQLPTWVVDNGWHRFLMVAIANDLTPGGAGACASGGGGTCIAVDLDIGSRTDVEAVAIAGGRELAGQDRDAAPGSAASWFEYSNAVLDDSASRRATTAAGNDQLFVISPVAATPWFGN